MAFAYRCNKCRTRNMFKRRLEDYIRTKKCHACGHVKFYWDYERNSKATYCTCEGYHFNHREGSTFCIHHPRYEWNVRVLRNGEDPEEVALDIAFNAEVPAEAPEEVPF